MVLWKSIESLHSLIREICRCIPDNEYKMRSQIMNAADSVSSNFIEGYYAGYVGEYIRFLTYSRRSAAELYERIKRVYERKITGTNLFNMFEECCCKTMYLIDRTKKA